MPLQGLVVWIPESVLKHVAEADNREKGMAAVWLRDEFRNIADVDIGIVDEDLGHWSARAHRWRRSPRLNPARFQLQFRCHRGLPPLADRGWRNPSISSSAFLGRVSRRPRQRPSAAKVRSLALPPSAHGGADVFKAVNAYNGSVEAPVVIVEIGNNGFGAYNYVIAENGYLVSDIGPRVKISEHLQSLINRLHVAIGEGALSSEGFDVTCYFITLLIGERVLNAALYGLDQGPLGLTVRNRMSEIEPPREEQSEKMVN
jgi:hypothetical protein